MLPGNELPLDRRRIGANGRFELADGGVDREEGGSGAVFKWSRFCVQDAFGLLAHGKKVNGNSWMVDR